MDINKTPAKRVKLYFQSHRYRKCNRMPNATTIEYPSDKASADFMMRTVLGVLHYKMLQEAERTGRVRRLLKLSVAFENLYTLYKEKGLDSEKITTERKD